MKTATAAVLLGLALCAVTAQAQTKDAPKTTDVVAFMNNNGHKLAAAVLEIAGVTKSASQPKARYTFLLPTDAAIQAFLKDMGLTVDDLKKRPLLAKALVGQHTLLRSNVRQLEIFEKGEERKAASMAAGKGKTDLVFKRAGGKAFVTDPQGFTANLVGKPIHPDENKTILPIDRVLLGGKYYTSFAAICKHRSSSTSSFCEAVKTAGLSDALAPKGGLDATVFLPDNTAFAKATASGKPSVDTLKMILQYHVVPGARELPKQWKGGAAFPTLLKGKDLKMTYTRMSAKGTPRKYDFAEARVVPSDGVGVPILNPNVFVGKSIANGIGVVLNPTATPAVTTEKGATAAAAAAPKPLTSQPRKLLGFGWDASGDSTAEMDDAESAIENAVDGNESVAQAANQSLVGAEELSVPGAYDMAERGIPY